MEWHQEILLSSWNEAELELTLELYPVHSYLLMVLHLPDLSHDTPPTDTSQDLQTPSRSTDKHISEVVV